MDKKGFELSINFIIVIILSAVILGFGMYIFSSLFEKTGDLKYSMDQASKRQIDQLLDSGEKVSLPRNAKTIQRGESFVFSLGIKADAQGDYSVSVDDAIAELDAVYEDSSDRMDEGETKYFPILVEVNSTASRGTYTLTVTVSKGSAIYGQRKVIYVNVS